MSRQEAEKNQAKTADSNADRANLDRQYGNIGISAVAAALPYAGKAKNPVLTAREEHDRRPNRRRSVLAV